MGKIRYFVPSFFTSLSLLSALVAIHYTALDEFILPAWLILFSMICDFLDGKFARILKAASPFGAQYDTLSDFVAFGIAPAFLAYRVSLQYLAYPGVIAALIYVFFGCYRLVRFSLRTKKTKSGNNSFIGLPIPAAAGFISTSIIFSLHHWNTIPNHSLFLISILLVSILMTSRIEYLTIDHSKFFPGKKIFLIVIILLLIILFFRYSYISFLFLIVGYIVLCPVRQLYLYIGNKSSLIKKNRGVSKL